MMNNAAPVDSVGHKIKRNVLPPDSLYILWTALVLASGYLACSYVFYILT